MKVLSFISFLLVFANVYSQVGIGTTSPNASSTLHLEDTTKGLLINRVALGNVTNGITPVNMPATGLLVYNTNATVTGGQGIGFYFWNGSQWQKLITNNDNNDWSLTGNTGTNPTNNFIGTTDNRDFVVRTNNTEKLRVESGGDVGIGTNNPSHTLEVQGDILFNGDFVNQEMIGVHSGTIQSIPYTNLVMTPITGTTNSITIVDGNGVNNSAVFISAFARVFGGSLNGSNSSIGGYFMVLQRDTNPAFPAPTILTYTSGICYIETPNGGVSAALGFGGGGHISYIDSALAPGTYYYRLAFYPNGVGITSGTYDVYQRDVNLIQIKR
ncbi:hypothetical protein [Flavobacterium okayamense]|uniref:Uncharacterized protein n=1 Tax=Flavobacterium okayamense TaxID=2830782 RepID=A0ABM7S0W3_9FLAO|nr:hypothetical protein [Flavobacterium okayamense]BCY27361.1 hypothetical protein KK2020170_02290 [Flavobacterium okayamense]